MRKRELVGLVFLIIGASGVYLSVRQTPPQYIYLTASRDISVGEIVSEQDFTPESLYLSNSENKYVSGSFDLDGHRALRSITRGEIIPRAAITSEIEVEERRLLTFVVAKSQAPEQLKSGDVIDLYFFSIPSNIALNEPAKLITVVEQVRIRAVENGQAQFDGKMTISALFDKNQTREIITLLANSSIAVAQRFDHHD